MTLARTIHRRNSRKRARAEALAEELRWIALTPEQRAAETAFLEKMRQRIMFSADAFAMLCDESISDLKFYGGEPWR